jgi:hypothetical protein
MAKKNSSRDRSNGGEKSNTGLIVTLVFFILATIGLGVTTYMGYGAKAEAEAKAKKSDSDASTEKKKTDEAEARRIAVKIAAGVADGGERGRFGALKGGAAAGPIKGDVTAFYTALQTQLNLNNTALPVWDPAAGDQPPKTLVAVAEDLQRQTAAALAAEKTAKDNLETARSEAKAAYDELQAKYKSTADNLAKKEAEVLTVRGEKFAGSESKDNKIDEQGKEVARLQLDLKNKETDLTRQIDKLKAEVESAKNVRKQFAEKWGPLLERLDQVRQARPELRDVQELHDLLLQALEGQQSLVNDSPKGKIVEIKPGQVYIDLGSAENIHPGVTFSVLPIGSTGRGAAAKPRKGAIEVVNVIGPHLSAAKVVEAANSARDPLLRGDLLFNPAWDPAQKVHVALAGIFDLNGSGVDGTQDLVRALERQGMIVDAWLDLKDRSIKGPGITERTTYLILGERPVMPPNLPPEGNPLGAAIADALGKISELKAKGHDMGVQEVPYRRFLSLIGYKLPKSVQQADYSSSSYLRGPGGLKPVEKKDEDKPK